MSSTKKEPRSHAKLFSRQNVISLIVRIVTSVVATLITMKAIGRF